MADHPNIPLVVDLDGTVIRTDMMWESIARLLRRNPFALFQILFWWSRGRAFLKQRLAARVTVNPADLPYSSRFLAWLKKQKDEGRHIVLATASDLEMARPVANHLGLFDEIMASDGKTNLRRENKRSALVQKFGERGFDYAGNSADDLKVWRSARMAIVVNASPAVTREAAQCAEAGPAFCEDYSRTAIAQRVFLELFWRSGYLVAIVAGVLLAMAFPKFNVSGFAWIAPALMLAAAYGKTGPDRFRAGFASGLAFWLISLGWLLLMPATGYPILAWLALAAYVALFFGAWTWLVTPPGTMSMSGLLNSWTARKPHAPPVPSVPLVASIPSVLEEGMETFSWSGRTLWALGGAAAWVALEMLRAWLFGGFPWSLLGVSQYQLVPLIQIAGVTGVYGVSFLVVWFSLSLYTASYMILRHPEKRQVWQIEIVLPMIAVVACYLGGFISMNQAVPARGSVRVTVIQPSVPQTLIWSPDDDARRFQELLELSQKALRPGPDASDLLVWPESAVPSLDEPTYQAINQFVRSNHVWLILNAEDVEFHPQATNFFNAAFLIDPHGRWRQAYHKRDLVIFGEYVPLSAWLPFLKWLTPISGGWTPGDRPVTFQLQLDNAATNKGVIQISSEAVDDNLGTVRCSPLICFEDTFPDSARDSAHDDVEFLVNLTNDGWFGQSAEQWQHLANSVFRAVENGIPLLRCANNGITCLVNSHGRVTDTFRDSNGSEYGPGVLTVDIPLPGASQPSAHTFYNRHGNWFGWLCIVTTAALAARKLRLSRNH
jgi:apolipoprotein N-acyltransferase